MNAASSISHFCPFLGLRDDADSSQAFPSNLNYCHHTQPIAAPRLNHQAEFCLAYKHCECPVFLREETASLPESILAHQTRAKSSPKNPGKYIAIIAVLLMGAAVFGWMARNPNSAALQAENTQTLQPILLPASNTPSAASVYEIAETPTPSSSIFMPAGTPTLHIPQFGSVTFTISPTPTASITEIPFVSKHRLDTPIGTDRKFIIHRLAKYESLDPYLEKYNTSMQAVSALNYYLYLVNPARRDILIVFPINFTDVSGMSVLVIYQLKESERGVNFEYLAGRFHIDLETFKVYNGITNVGERPLVGDYYLLPLKRLIP